MEVREGYYDYMTRRLREDTSKMSLIEKDMVGLTKSHYNVLKHLIPSSTFVLLLNVYVSLSF